MSVVELIRDRTVIERLEPLIDAASYRRTVPVPAIVPWSRAAHAGVMGVAFDYALRFQLLRATPNAVAAPWIAELSVDNLAAAAARIAARPARSPAVTARSAAASNPIARFARCGAFRTRNARIFLQKHLRRRRVDDPWLHRLCVHALKLARLDAYYRSGYCADALVTIDLPAAVDELVALVRAVPMERFSARAMWLNPSFGRYSTLVGGADADVIADGRLTELKVRTKACLERHDVRQLFLYAMLADFARSEEPRMPTIEVVQVYFARHAAFTTIDLAQVRKHHAYDSARESILRRARERYAADPEISSHTAS